MIVLFMDRGAIEKKALCIYFTILYIVMQIH